MFSWQLQIAAYPHIEDNRERSRIWHGVERLTTFTLNPKKSVYDQMPREQRILAIGSSLAVGGEDWLHSHPRQEEWLKREGITPAVCLQTHQAWLAEQMKNPGWR